MSDLTLVTLDYPPDRGGVARFLGNLAKESSGAMKVLVPEGHGTDGPGEVSSARMFRNAWPRWWPTVKAIKDLKNETKTVFVSHVFPVGTAAWIAKMMGGPDYIVLFHGLDLKLIRSFWKKWLLRRICASSKALFVNSHATKTLLSSLVPKALPVVMTPGVEKIDVPTREHARKELGLSPDQEIILSVTRLVRRKGIDLTLHAMLRIQAKRDVSYVVIGDGPDKARLEKTAEEFKTKVRWITDADDAEKWLWFAAADVFVLPAREEKDDMEGFGIVYLEAALVGLPSVAGKCGGAIEAVKNDVTGLLVNPKSIDCVEAAIIKLLDDPGLRQTMGEAGRKRALENFRWEDRWIELASVLGMSAKKPSGRVRGEAVDIAVIIPCFNHAKELSVTLKALAGQTVMPREVVVVDNGSDDQPEAVVEKFKHALPIQVVRFTARQGAPAARNHGASLTDSASLLFLDADVELTPDAMARLSEALEENSDAALAYSNFYWDFKKFPSRPWNPEALKKLNYIHTTALIRRKDFSGFDESLKKFQDWDLWLTMAENGAKGIYVDKYLFRVKQRKSGISTWLPSFVHKVSWPVLGWTPKEIKKYREAEKIIKQKHSI